MTHTFSYFVALLPASPIVLLQHHKKTPFFISSLYAWRIIITEGHILFSPKIPFFHLFFNTSCKLTLSYSNKKFHLYRSSSVFYISYSPHYRPITLVHSPIYPCIYRTITLLYFVRAVKWNQHASHMHYSILIPQLFYVIWWTAYHL